ncbi:Transcriptional repressor rco-like protein [Hapsidospora chrysogenum ATCC 11550]|uniref:Transcriptional repressor rco-like protein n=1 Tax=Hapsidospora chrysogenum (strain ATCC 11550 / CBS 779.69 / DSM 880 / IAM 14645 / JCM 23072 / IMI 49137) TaxID=857340 RepID=A0A086T180_HAPC1|nr:Transcriptional repressor rco-like protein [Hapsidospora chrysogenum ATCC 11550]
MSMYPHRGMGAVPPGNSSRLNELLDQIRAEFDTQLRQTEGLEHQISAQVSEMQLVREKVYAMEQTHMTLKQKYEEELSVLRHQLAEATRGKGGAGQPAMAGPPPHAGPSQQQPPSIAPGNGLFSGIMAGGNQGGLAPPQQQQPQQQQPQQQQQPPHQQHGPPQEQQMGPQHQMAQAAPGLPVPPPHAPTQAQQQQQGPYQQQPYGGPMSNGMASQPPPGTASPGPGRWGVGRPPNGVGPTTPQINTPVPYPGNAQSPSISQPTPDHPRMGGPRAPPPPVGNALGDLELDSLAPHNKKTGNEWHAIFNPQVQRVLDVDLVHSLQHDSVVCCVRFSQDGKYVATGCNKSAQIFDVASGEKICVLEDHNASDPTGSTDLYIRSVCFSPDGRYLATGAEDKIIRVWDIQNRTIRNHFTGHEQDIYSLDFARDGRTIASGSGDRTVRLWDIEEGVNTMTLTIEDGVTTVAISPDTQYVAAGSLDKSVRVWSIPEKMLVERLEGADGHKDSVYSVAFSPNGKDLVSGSLDRTIKMWELGAPRSGRDGIRAGKCIKTFEGHRDFVLSVALTPDANWVLSGSKDRGVQFWDPRTGTTQLMLQGHKNSVISVAPSPQGGYFATGSGDQKARIWSYRPL